MKKKIGVIFNTVNGQTLKICKEITKKLNNSGYNTDLVDISSFDKNILDYSALIIGTSVRHKRHKKKIARFIKKNQNELQQVKTAFFSVDLLVRANHSTPYNTKYFNQLNWKPDIIDLFAGQLGFDIYSLFNRKMARLVTTITNDVKTSNSPMEHTTLIKFKNFSEHICMN